MQVNGDAKHPPTPRRSSRSARSVLPEHGASSHASIPVAEKKIGSSTGPTAAAAANDGASGGSGGGGGHSRARNRRARMRTQDKPGAAGPSSPGDSSHQRLDPPHSSSSAIEAFDQNDPEDMRRMELLSRLNQIERQRRELTRSQSVSFGAVSIPSHHVDGRAARASQPTPTSPISPSKRQRPGPHPSAGPVKRRRSDPSNESAVGTRAGASDAASTGNSPVAATVSSLPSVAPRTTRQSAPPRHSPAVSARGQTSRKPPPTPTLDLAKASAAPASSSAARLPRASARATSAPLSPTGGRPSTSLGRFSAPGSPPSSPGSPSGRSGRVRTPSVLLTNQPGEGPAPIHGPGGKQIAKNNQVSYCVRIVKDILRLKDSFAFAKPIDKLWPRDQLPGYFEMISHPMDLSTILAKLENGSYLADPEDGAPANAPQVFEAAKYALDMRLVFDNARTYNRPGDIFYEAATRLSEKFEAKFAELPSYKDPASASNKKKKKKDPLGSAGVAAAGASGSSRKENKRRKASSRAAAAGPGEDAAGNGGSGSGGRAASLGTKSKSRRQSGNSSGGGGGGGRSGGGGGSGAGGARNGDSEISASSKDPSKMSQSEMEERLRALKRQLSILDAPSPSPSPTSGTASYLIQAQALYHVPMSFEEKVKLSENVGQLSGDKLQKLVALISRNTSSTMEVNNEEEIELDIDNMDNKTLRDMEAFIHQTLYRRRSGAGKNGGSPRAGELSHLTRDQVTDQIETISAALKSSSRRRGENGDSRGGQDGQSLKREKSFYDDSDSSSDSDSSGSSSDSGSSDSSDSSDDESSDDDSEGDEKRKRRERNLEHMRKMGQASSQPGSGTPLPSPAYSGVQSSVAPGGTSPAGSP